MSNLTTIAATTITNISGNSRKFYRIYVMDSVEIRQWGRIGTRGQFSVRRHGGKRTAETEAEAQLRKKENGGYRSRQNLTFPVNTERFGRMTDGDLGAALDALHQAAEEKVLNGADSADTPSGNFLRTGATTPAWDEPEPKVSLETFSERALKVVTQAAVGTADAAIGYTKLREEFTGMTEQYERCESLLETIEAMLTGTEVGT